ncbi:MAG: hypothetical protein ACJ75Z_12310 [Solirubrobacterales bacterium]
MKSNRSRLALMGVLALAISVTVGLVSGSVAEAKKKKSKRSFTVSKTSPTVVPAAPSPGGTAVAKFAIGSVGSKVAKGKVVSLNGVNATTAFSGAPGFAGDVTTQLIAPSGRNTFLINPVVNDFGPGPSTETSSGPLTETPNSALGVCVPNTPAPPPPCSDPDNVVGPPYSGTVGNSGLLNFSGSGAVGTWFLKVFNGGSNPVTVNSVSVTGGLIIKPQ